MITDETGEKARPFTEGNKLYQERARAALPLLVRQAKAQKTIYYGDLAAELGMSNARNLNFVLGSVGVTLNHLAKAKGWEIPPVQCLVINQTTKLPGEGVGVFISKEEFRAMSTTQQREVVKAQLFTIFSYPHWDEVLEAFELQPATLDYRALVQEAATRRFGEGESDAHRSLKERIAANPTLVGLPANFGSGATEHALPSGDKLDVLFKKRDEWIAVEVKSEISDDADLARGMFQCVKYQAVLEAWLLSQSRRAQVRTILVTVNPLSAQLAALKNVLGIEWMRISAA